MQKHGSIFKGAMLVTGTTIGGGMLALPVLTSPGGFLPSIIIYILCWLFMSLTGLLFLELSLQMEDGVNILSMAKRTLGPAGKAFAWVLYLFLFYCLNVAYVVGCGDILNSLFPEAIPRLLGSLVFVLLFAPLIYLGPKFIGKLNIFMMAGLAISYLGFVIIGANAVDTNLLTHRNWSASLIALPIAFTAFAYQGIIPTLVTYLDRNAFKVKASIWIGSTISLVTYIIWAWLILGIVPFSGSNGLEQTLAEGRNAVYPLKAQLNHPYIYVIGQSFAFFALVTSFFGVTLGLIDFLADGLKIKKTAAGKALLSALVFVPALTISLIYPDIFLVALDYAGGYGCSLLLGLLPILMVAVWRKRYPESERIVPGGNLLLGALFMFVLAELAIEILT